MQEWEQDDRRGGILAFVPGEKLTPILRASPLPQKAVASKSNKPVAVV